LLIRHSKYSAMFRQFCPLGYFSKGGYEKMLNLECTAGVPQTVMEKRPILKLQGLSVK